MIGQIAGSSNVGVINQEIEDRLKPEPVEGRKVEKGVSDIISVTKAQLSRWFNGLADAKCKVQKGQVTTRADRPPLNLPYFKSYANRDLCWTAEGM